MTKYLPNVHIYRTIRRLTDDIDNRIRLADLGDAIRTMFDLGVGRTELHYIEYNVDLMARTICRACHET